MRRSMLVVVLLAGLLSFTLLSDIALASSVDKLSVSGASFINVNTGGVLGFYNPTLSDDSLLIKAEIKLPKAKRLLILTMATAEDTAIFVTKGKCNEGGTIIFAEGDELQNWDTDNEDVIPYTARWAGWEDGFYCVRTKLGIADKWGGLKNMIGSSVSASG